MFETEFVTIHRVDPVSCFRPLVVNGEDLEPSLSPILPILLHVNMVVGLIPELNSSNLGPKRLSVTCNERKLV